MQSITRAQLATIIGQKTLEIKDSKELASAVSAYLAEERLATIDVSVLMRDVMQYRLEKGLLEAHVISAHELTPLVLNDVEALLRRHYPAVKSITLVPIVDTNLVGGVRIELPQEILDLSVRGKLNRFKRLVAEGKA
jgi:F0F1-type ATP synthase delta subunit